MPTLRTLRNKADAQARTLGHHAVRFSTNHSSAMSGACADCGAWVSVRSNDDESPISGTAIRETCAEYKAQHPQEQTEQKYVNGKRRACVCLGEWVDRSGRRYTAWRALHSFLDPWIRLEPFDGGRARSAYDPGKAILGQIDRDRRAHEEEQADA